MRKLRNINGEYSIIYKVIVKRGGAIVFNRPELDFFIMNSSIKKMVEEGKLQPFKYDVFNPLLLNKLFNNMISIEFSNYNELIYDYSVNYLRIFDSFIHKTLTYILKVSGISTDLVDQEKSNNCEALFLPTVRDDNDEPQFLPPILDSLFVIRNDLNFLNTEQISCLSDIDTRSIGFSHQKMRSLQVGFSDVFCHTIVYFIYTRMMLSISHRLEGSIDLYRDSSVRKENRSKIDKYIKHGIFFSPYTGTDFYKIPVYFKPIVDALQDVRQVKVLFNVNSYKEWCEFIERVNDVSNLQSNSFSSLLLAEIIGAEGIFNLYRWESTTGYYQLLECIKNDLYTPRSFLDDFISLNLMLPPTWGRLRFKLLQEFSNTNNLLVSDKYKTAAASSHSILKENLIYYNKYLYRLVFIAFPALNTLIDELIDKVLTKYNNDCLLALKKELDRILTEYIDKDYGLEGILKKNNSLKISLKERCLENDSFFKRFYRRELHYNPFNRYFDYSEANYLVNEEEVEEYKEEVICGDTVGIPKAKVIGVLDFINKNLVAKDKKNGHIKLECFKLYRETQNPLFGGKIDLICIQIALKLLIKAFPLEELNDDLELNSALTNDRLGRGLIDVIQELLLDYNNQEQLGIEQLLALSKFIKPILKGTNSELCHYQESLNGIEDPNGRYPKKIYNIGKLLRKYIEDDENNKLFFIGCIKVLFSNDLDDFERLLKDNEPEAFNEELDVFELTVYGKLLSEVIALIVKIRSLVLKWILKFVNLDNSNLTYNELDKYIEQHDFQYSYKYLLEKHHLFLNPSWKEYSKVWDGMLDRTYYNPKYNL